MGLADLLDPAATTVVTLECQRGVIGDLSPFAELRDAAVGEGVLDNGPALCRAARSAGSRVVHAIALHRADGAGGAANCRMLMAAHRARENGQGVIEGTPAADLVPAFGPQPEDIVLSRLHGLTPFTATSLDQVLRNLGTRTVVPAGVSLNIGVLGLVISAVDLGYDVVVPTDAVAGVPAEYGNAVLRGTLGLLATLATTAEITAAWS